MKGSHVSDEELKLAEEFLVLATKTVLPQEFRINGKNLIRLLAWYASIRVNGDKSGSLINVQQLERIQ